MKKPLLSFLEPLYKFYYLKLWRFEKCYLEDYQKEVNCRIAKNCSPYQIGKCCYCLAFYSYHYYINKKHLRKEEKLLEFSFIVFLVNLACVFIYFVVKKWFKVDISKFNTMILTILDQAVMNIVKDMDTDPNLKLVWFLQNGVLILCSFLLLRFEVRVLLFTLALFLFLTFYDSIFFFPMIALYILGVYLLALIERNVYKTVEKRNFEQQSIFDVFQAFRDSILILEIDQVSKCNVIFKNKKFEEYFMSDVDNSTSIHTKDFLDFLSEYTVHPDCSNASVVMNLNQFLTTKNWNLTFMKDYQGDHFMIEKAVNGSFTRKLFMTVHFQQLINGKKMGTMIFSERQVGSRESSDFMIMEQDFKNAMDKKDSLLYTVSHEQKSFLKMTEQQINRLQSIIAQGKTIEDNNIMNKVKKQKSDSKSKSKINQKSERTIELDKSGIGLKNILDKSNIVKSQIIDDYISLPKQILVDSINWIKFANNMLQSLMGDILDRGQILESNITLHPQWVSLNEIISLVEKFNTMNLSKKNLTLKKSIISDKSHSILIFNDKQRIFQILQNLVSNAIKNTGRNGEIAIKCSFVSDLKKSTIKPQKQIQIEISDNGCGMKEDIQKRIFEYFGTFDKKKENNGIGLGLFIVSNLAQVVGPEQQVEVQSQLGKGSTFKFRIYQNIESRDAYNVTCSQSMWDGTAINDEGSIRNDVKEAGAAKFIESVSSYNSPRCTVFKSPTNQSQNESFQYLLSTSRNPKQISSKRSQYKAQQSYQNGTISEENYKDYASDIDKNITFSIVQSQQQVASQKDLSNPPMYYNNSQQQQISNISVNILNNQRSQSVKHQGNKMNIEIQQYLSNFKKILIIDDSTFCIQGLELTLEGIGVDKQRIVWTNFGEQALELIQQDMDIQFVFCDHQFGQNNWNGSETAHKINQLNRDIPIVLLTSDPNLSQSNDPTFLLVLEKPLKIKEFYEKLKQLK